MKTKISVLLGAGLVLLLAGCSSTPVALAPVGPNPDGLRVPMATGQLEVFSAMVTRVEGNNPTWHQHADYYLYDQQGKELRHVDNTVGYYAQAPRVITLPAGMYIVEARAKGIPMTEVPVMIEPGQTTRVHLDDKWRPPSDSSKTELVSAPTGYPVGWRSNPIK